MPPVRIRYSDGTSARCGRTIHTGERFTWGRDKRIFHPSVCPPGPDGTPPIPPRGDEAFAEDGDTFQQDAPPNPRQILAGGDPLDQVGALLRQVIGDSIQQSALESVKAEIGKLKAKIEGFKPPVIEVKRPDETKVKIEGAHAQFQELLAHLAAGKNVYAHGLPGAGKSYAARQVSEALGRQYGYISLNPMTPDSRLLGFMDLNPGNKDEEIYRGTPYYNCYVNGGVFCIDELDNASASLLTTINGQIENGHGAFPCGVKERHKDFVLIATGNTAGNGGDALFPERRVFDAAFRERFVFMEFGYDLALEERMCLGINPKARPWLDWVRAARDFASREKIRCFFSPRVSRDGADLLRPDYGFKYETTAEVADRIAFRGVPQDLRDRVTRAVPLPSISRFK